MYLTNKIESVKDIIKVVLQTQLYILLNIHTSLFIPMHKLFLFNIPFIIQVTIINSIHIPLVTTGSQIKYDPIILYYFFQAERSFQDVRYLILLVHCTY